MTDPLVGGLAALALTLQPSSDACARLKGALEWIEAGVGGAAAAGAVAARSKAIEARIFGMAAGLVDQRDEGDGSHGFRLAASTFAIASIDRSSALRAIATR